MLQDRLLDGRLKLRHLVLLTAVADHGTVVAAAKALHITQPVVTRAIHELEEILGVSLFDRGPRGVTPTIYGEGFIAHARAVLAQVRQAAAQIDELSRADVGQVVVGTHLAGANLLLPSAIGTLKEEHPRLTVVVREATPDLLLHLLQSGEVDLTVGRLTARPPEGLRQERLYLEPISLVARVEHPIHLRTGPSLAEMSDLPWIFPVEQTELRSELEAAFLAEGISLPDNRVECTSMPTLRQLLVTTDVIAALPRLIALNDSRLRIVSTNLPTIRRSVGVAIPSDRPLMPATAALLEHLRAAASRLDVG